MPTFNMLQAKSSLSRLVKSVEDGSETEIIIARNGKPAARLVPIQPLKDVSRRLGRLDGIFPGMTLEEFDADNEEIAELFNGPDE